MLSEELLKAVKSIGLSLSYLVKENEFSLIDDIAHSTTKKELIEKLYNAARVLLSAAYQSKIGDEAKYLEAMIDRLVNQLQDEPSEITYVAKLIGLYAIARGIKEIAREKRGE